MAGKPFLRRVVPGAFAALALAATPAAAHASTVGDVIAGCGSEPLERPFARWLDPATYVLAPGGTIEGSMAGWTLRGGARVVDGDEPFDVHGPGERRALEIPAGASATTPAQCADLAHPTVRLFAANGGGLLSTLRVDVVFDGPLGLQSLPIGLVAGGSAWRPTLPMLVLANVLGSLPEGRTSVAFRFVAQGGPWRIDDVYVDPYARH